MAVVGSLDQLAGLVLDGRYRLVRRVGEGGFGVVYRGEVAGSPMPVAVKLLRFPADATDDERAALLQKFAHEAAVLRKLRHPNIVSALDGGLVTLADGTRTAYLVLEWCEGSTLKDRLQATRGRGLPPREAWRLLRPVCEAAAHAHAHGVVHRDLKPANVMLVPTRGGVVPRVIDFGIAKAMSPDVAVGSGDTMTTTVARAFTPAYAAPEQVVGLRSGPWTDVHALALMLVELVAGRPAYEPEQERFAIIAPTRPTPKTLGLDVGPWEVVLASALALQPGDRIPNAATLLCALDEGLDAADAALCDRSPPPLVVGAQRSPSLTTTAPDAPRPRRARSLALAFTIGVATVGAVGAGALVLVPRLARGRAGAAAPSISEDAADHALDCDQTARSLDEPEGASRLTRCPGGCERTRGTVWGTDIYTDDSPVCAAAAHAGVVGRGGGRVLVTFAAGVAAYVGTKRNGITSVTWDKGWGRSFYVRAVDARGAPTSPPPPGADPKSPLVTCTDSPQALALRGLSRVTCPAGCPAARVYGSGPYSSDSSLCAAARHAGALPDGGAIGFSLGPATKGFKGSTRHGVVTSDWGGDHQTFTLVR
jgi:serine/threonine protein kinase